MLAVVMPPLNAPLIAPGPVSVMLADWPRFMSTGTVG